MSSDCCTYGCTQSKDCPARAAGVNHGIDWHAFDKPAATPPIDMFEPTGWLATMEWLQHTIVLCLVSVVVGVAATTIYFLTRG